jgi:hypothetical protein
MCTSSARWLPSGCGIAALPRKVPSFTSAIEAFTTGDDHCVVRERELVLGAVLGFQGKHVAVRLLDRPAQAQRLLLRCRRRSGTAARMAASASAIVLVIVSSGECRHDVTARHSNKGGGCRKHFKLLGPVWTFAVYEANPQ